MNEIKLENLDDSFFEDLRDGNFILVLGAGFSFDVPNKAGGKIPIGYQFAKLTKDRFDLSYIPDYSNAAEVWETIVNSDTNLLNEFRNLFLVDETKFDSKLYSSIFLPNWYNIFTLNFDNVLEITQKNTQRKQMEIFSYPDDGTDSEKPDIIHLHGVIKDDTTFDRIVFTPQSYAELPDKIHTPYDVLYGDVKTHKKNVLILGSQFKEISVRQKFFKELPKNKSVKIYHFDIKTELEYVTDFTERDYKFILLEESKGGVKHFLQFLQANKDRIENIHIEGAEIINSTFVKKIKEGEKFTPADFYTAKQNDSCQWYGVMQDYDVVRNDYEKIRNIALKCFDKPYFNKVAAIIHGFGGCGKSTLLRRLAVELKDAPFKIVWLKDREFDNLADIGLTQIKEDNSRNYLLIIEDWYRITANEKTKEFLLNSQTIPNLRIIIGDREKDGKEYINNLYEITNQFHLQPEENEKIINDILDKFRDWQPAAEKVIKNNAAKNTSLFLLLFVIARINEEQFGDTEIDFSDPSSAFRDIIKSDLKKINAKYPGLVKALYNWACIYTNYKIFIDINSFLKIADAYNGNADVSEGFSNWNGHFPEMHRLKNYININKKTDLKNKKLHSIDFVQFNHDKLAEDGLACAVLEGWDSFYNPVTRKYENDNLLKDLLKIVLKYGDDYSSSVLLSKMLMHQKQIFANSSEKLGYINQLYKKGNFQSEYLNRIADKDIDLSPPEIKKYLYELFEKQIYPAIIWLDYFKKADKEARFEAAKLILQENNIILLPYTIVVLAFNLKVNENEFDTLKTISSKRILDEIIISSDISSFPTGNVIKAFEVKGNQIEKMNAAIKILTLTNIFSIYGGFIKVCFEQKGYDEQSKEEIAIAKHVSAIKILAAPDITLLQPEIVAASFNQKGYDEQSKQDIEKAKHVSALKIIKALIDSNDIISINEHIVFAAFNQKGYDEQSKQDIKKAKHEAAIIILAATDITSLQNDIVFAAFNQKGYDEKSKQEIGKAKHEAAIKILEDYDWDRKKDTLMFQALGFFSTEATYSNRVNELVTEIINQFHQHKHEKNSHLYYKRLIMIVGYPFHNIPLWKDNCLYYISNWRNKKTINFFVKVLHSFRSHPEEIKAVCEQILKNWKIEVVIEIRQLYGEAHKGDHIKIALGHPDLKEIAMIAAKEMAAEEEKNPNTLPGYLLEIVLKIVQEKPEFPEWNKNTANEFNTQLSE